MLPNEDTSVSTDHIPNKDNSTQEQENFTTPQSRLAQAIRSLFLPLQVRNYSLLFSGQLASTFGDAFYAVALPWLILTSGGSPTMLGTVLAAYGIPRIGTMLIGGWLSDKFRPRWIMLGADIGRALLTGILVVLAIGGHPTLWQLCAIAVPLGALSGVFLPAYFAMTPEVLPDDALQAGNALISSSTELALLLGPSIAGIVIGIARSAVAFMIDAFSFVISAITLAAMYRTRIQVTSSTDEIQDSSSEAMEQPTAASHSQSLWEVLCHSQFLQVSLVITIIANLTIAGAMEVALPTLVRGPLAGNAFGYGLLLAAFSAGSLIGSLGSGMLGKLPHRGLIALVIGLVQAGATIFIPLTGTFVGAATFLVIAGLTNGVNNVFYTTILQQKVPRYLLGRIMGIMMFCAYGLYPLSTVLGGFVTQQLGYSLMFTMSGIALAVAFAYGFFRPEFRDL